MVSLWPWRGDDTSPASFEKALSALSIKISKSQQQLDKLRQRSRRFKALWTLYTSFAYLLCAIILALVVGWKNWGAWEYSAVAGSPLLIYLVRTAITTYYKYRIDTVTYRLEEQQSERAKTIDKLKAATKYDSTQQLLEKYGGASAQSSPKPKVQGGSARAPRKSPKQSQRNTIGPPATANIPRNQPVVSSPSTPQQMPPIMNKNTTFVSSSPVSGAQPGPPEFAPNAFAAAPQYDCSSESNVEGKWYDRILDLLLGEDETSPKNRVVLICQHCRLINGQAPPGVKRVEELGKWRCIGCGGWNGDIDEGAKIVEEMKEKVESESLTQSEMPESDKQGAEGLSEDSLKDHDEGGLEEDDYEEIDKGVDAGEEPVPKMRSGRKNGTGQTKS